VDAPGSGTPLCAGATAALAALPEACLVTDAAQTIVSANTAFTLTTGYTAEEALGRNCRFLQGADTDRDTVRAIRAALAAGESFSGVLRNYRKSGEAFWNEVSIAPLTDDEGAISGFISVQRDVTEHVDARTRTRQLLVAAEAQRGTLSSLLSIARTLAGQTSTSTVLPSVARAILTLCGADRSCIELWDPSMSRLSMAEGAGWPGRMEDRVRAFTISPDDSPELADIVALREPVLITRSDPSDWGRSVLDEFELSSIAAVPVETADALIGLLVACWADTPCPPRLEPDLHARLAGLAGIAAYAIHNASLIDQVRWSASHDPLTGLATRDLLETELTAALHAMTGDSGLAVVFCDLNEFKRTNDSYGHAAGDLVLQEIASRLKAVLRSTDLVARIGGDEFVILLTPVQHETEVEAVLHRLHQALDTPVVAGGVTVEARLSTGVAHHPPRSPHTTARALIQDADADMYRRKIGRNLPPWAAPGPDQQRLQEDLSAAVQLGQLHAYYQPQLDLATGRIVAVEALARWDHPELGLLEPDRFIALAEATGLIQEIGRQMLETACRDALVLRRRIPGLTMSVNVSRRELVSTSYAQELHQLLTRCALPPAALTLEITESHLAGDPALLRQQAHALRAYGVRIALDDFGTGYTAIPLLQNIPITELKIDRSFVQQPPTPGADLVAGIVALAHELHLTVVAEGVETRTQLDHLRAIGCDRAQGYAIGPALPIEQLDGLIRTRP
jgi:diguanylate cyclase (GGDEF)-like protein/PAS domain S-box-containing protein